MSAAVKLAALSLLAAYGCSFDASGVSPGSTGDGAVSDGAQGGADGPAGSDGTISAVDSSLVAIDGAISTADAAPCTPPAGCSSGSVVTAITDRCVTYCTSALTWTSAQAVCEAAGGDLVTLNSSTDNTAVATAVGANDVWIGFFQDPNDPEPSGSWEWISGIALAITPLWQTGQPNNNTDLLATGQDCGFIRGAEAKWYDHECTASLRYLCERP